MEINLRHTTNVNEWYPLAKKHDGAHVMQAWLVYLDKTQRVGKLTEWDNRSKYPSYTLEFTYEGLQAEYLLKKHSKESIKQDIRELIRYVQQANALPPFEIEELRKIRQINEGIIPY